MKIDRARARRQLPLVGLGLLVLAAAIVIAQPEPSGGVPLDPASTAGDGTKALVEVLDELGADVTVSARLPEREDVALLLTDDLDGRRRSKLRRWVDDGGTLVVTDPRSRFAPEPVGNTSVGLLQTPLRKACDLPALADVQRVTAPSSTTYETPAGATGCFERRDGHWMVVREQGDGIVVALGGPGFLVNGGLGRNDNALLAAALLAPQAGTGVAFLQPAAPGSGDSGLLDLIPTRVRLALLQLGLAFGVVVAWRARRLGRPVVEEQPVAVPGSELVVAVGNLLQQTRARRRAAFVLREGLRRDLAERLGLPRGADDHALADAAAARSEVGRDDVLTVLTGPDPAGEAQLVALAQQVARLRHTVLAPIDFRGVRS